MHSLAEEILHDGFTRVPFKSSDLLPNIIDGWNKFRALPDDEKDRWTITLPQDILEDPTQGPDTGFRRGAREYIPPEERKLGSGSDPKCRFHHTPLIFPALNERDIDWRPQAQWLAHCDLLFFRARNLLLRFIQAHGEELGLPKLEVDPDAGRLRLLHYEPRSTGELTVVAKKHQDRCSWTVHIAESYPGLYIDNGTPEGSLITIPQNTAMIFPGAKTAKLTNGRIPALEHWVIDKSHSSVSRWSIVSFWHFRPV